MESDDFAEHYIIRLLSARELVLLHLVDYSQVIAGCVIVSFPNACTLAHTHTHTHAHTHTQSWSSILH